MPENHPPHSQFRDSWLPDYCPRCNPAGDQADRRVRLASMTEPDAVTWHGGKRVICDYVCDRCSYSWTRRDLWDARSAGFAA
ncbi:hypothetical protein [Mycobacterium paragordonae]|uniref:hypothetical protein n=1 Tax=Mycobacterium paragordonae TaxID=1389713 RepID=UPI0012E15C7B|nr:hypothetical protein [Mycobacterium paragordonae]